jgi:CheY-like chemotaxis protein
MRRVFLIHWNAAEAAGRVDLLRGAGFQVRFDPLDLPAMRVLRDEPPDAVVIDLTRLPSHGREVAGAIRRFKATRGVPLVFAEGEPEKVARIRELLPDAVYTRWDEIGAALERALANAPTAPVVPRSAMAAYAGRPVAKKLGIKANSVVGLLGAPPEFAGALGELPSGVSLREGLRGACDLMVWFVRSRGELEHDLDRVSRRIGPGGLWIAWPKQGAGIATDLSQAVVRRIGLAAGLVDYKISAIDATWAGLRFTRRK